MGESFISRKDRIIASAIEIISESGLASLSTKSLARKENMSEALIYKYFGGINEVLIEVVQYLFDLMRVLSGQYKQRRYLISIRFMSFLIPMLHTMIIIWKFPQLC